MQMFAGNLQQRALFVACLQMPVEPDLTIDSQSGSNFKPDNVPQQDWILALLKRARDDSQRAGYHGAERGTAAPPRA